MSHYLIIGLGKIGLPVTNLLSEQGNHHQVTAVNHSYRANLAANITFIQKDARWLITSEFGVNSDTIAHACIIVNPSDSSEQGYQDSCWAICQNFVQVAQFFPNLQRVVFISSTSVYGQNQGEIIDIATPLTLQPILWQTPPNSTQPPLMGKRIISNLPPQWLSVVNWQEGYDLIMASNTCTTN